MKAFFLIAAVLCCLGASPAMAQMNPFAGLTGELRIVGSDVGLVAFREAADKIMADNPGISVQFALTGSGAGIRRIRQRQADICLFDRDPSLISTAGSPLAAVAYGVDPVAVVVNPVNTVGPLSAEQLKQVFSARIRFWNDLGGGEYPVMPIYIEASETEGKPDTKPGNVSVSSQPAMRFTLARNKETIGCISLRDLDASLKPVAVDGVSPDMRAFKEGRYRVYSLMYAVTEQTPSRLAKVFLDYMSGPEGQSLLAKTGYLPLADKPSWESVLPVGNPDKLAGGS